jgi:hypothetical protein
MSREPTDAYCDMKSERRNSYDGLSLATSAFVGSCVCGCPPTPESYLLCKTGSASPYILHSGFGIAIAVLYDSTTQAKDMIGTNDILCCIPLISYWHTRGS